MAFNYFLNIVLIDFDWAKNNFLKFFANQKSKVDVSEALGPVYTCDFSRLLSFCNRLAMDFPIEHNTHFIKNNCNMLEKVKMGANTQLV